mmetsp:Transcript_4858/g.9775  ORF Transcript_4858/g.9775 Transcript_4858/m.9775 type:complete len:415 (+) Transcript_4858:239-1483(+)
MEQNVDTIDLCTPPDPPGTPPPRPLQPYINTATSSSSSLTVAYNTPAFPDSVEDPTFTSMSHKSSQSSEDDLLDRPVYLPEFDAQETNSQRKRREKQDKNDGKKKKKPRKKDDTALLEKEANGHFKEKEICVVIENKFCDSGMGQTITSSLQAANTMYSPDPSSKIEGSMRWFRRPHSLGGASSVLTEEENVDSGFVAVVFEDPKRFLKLLKRTDLTKDDYPRLREWVVQVRENFSDVKRLFIVVVDVMGEIDTVWNNSPQRRNSGLPPSVDDLEEAIIWMLMEEQIECVPARSQAEACEYLMDMTKSLTKQPYEVEPSELQCMNKAKKDDKNDAKSYFRRMLVQLPQVTAIKVDKLMEQYPTLTHLVNAYAECEDDESRAGLLQDKFGGGQVEGVLSERIWKFICSRNGDDMW